MKIPNRPSLMSWVLLLSLGTPPVLAQFEDDSQEPIEITADSMEWLNSERIAIARGNADAVQGRYTLSADVLTAHMAETPLAEDSNAVSRIRRIDAEGNVILTTPKETARGGTGTYDLEKKVAVLVGSVVLTQGDNVLHGQKLIMDLTTGRSRLEGTPPTTSPKDGGRVRAIFTPSQNEQ